MCLSFYLFSPNVDIFYPSSSFFLFIEPHHANEKKEIFQQNFQTIFHFINSKMKSLFQNLFIRLTVVMEFHWMSVKISISSTFLLNDNILDCRRGKGKIEIDRANQSSSYVKWVKHARKCFIHTYLLTIKKENCSHLLTRKINLFSSWYASLCR